MTLNGAESLIRLRGDRHPYSGSWMTWTAVMVPNPAAAPVGIVTVVRNVGPSNPPTFVNVPEASVKSTSP